MVFKISEVDECGHENFYQFGRCLYNTDCGPWVVAVLPDGTEIYYDSDEGSKLPIDTEVDYLQVGSIVEGSDYYVGPLDVTDPKDFWDVVKAVNDEACAAWDHFNHDWLSVFKGDEPAGWAKAGWDDDEYFGEGLTEKEQRVFIRWLKRYGYESQRQSWFGPYKKKRMLCTNIWVQQEDPEFTY